jgi:hypothetical protein
LPKRRVIMMNKREKDKKNKRNESQKFIRGNRGEHR